MNNRKEHTSVLRDRELEVSDLGRLMKEIDNYQLQSTSQDNLLFDSIFSALAELWFKTRANNRQTDNSEKKAIYEIDGLYIKNAFLVLKRKFKQY